MVYYTKPELEKLTRHLTNKIQRMKDTYLKKKKVLDLVSSELQKAIIRQKQLESVKGEFLTILSHELRTPLTPMLVQSQMLLSGNFGVLSKNQKKSIEMILRNTRKLERLTGDIMDISNLNAGMMNFFFKKDSLQQVVQKAVETVEPLAQTKDVQLILKSSTLPEMILDEKRISQVLLNLLENAIKFTPEKKRIIIYMETIRSDARVTIKDEGIGIEKKDLRMVFHPFAQVYTGRSRDQEGTGLGLAICKGIIAAHRGRIKVESEFGKGSKFIFTLPLKPKIKEGKRKIKLRTR